MTTEQSHETSAEHSCGCGHEHGESHESPKPQEVVVESSQPQTQSGKLITITAKAAEKINEFMAEEKDKPDSLESMFKAVVVLDFLTDWVSRKQQRKMI